MPWRLPPTFHPGHLAPSLAQIEPILAMTFVAFDKACIVSGIEDGALVVEVRHLGGPKMQATMAAIVQRQLDLTLPDHYRATLVDVGTPAVRLLVAPCDHRHKTAA